MDEVDKAALRQPRDRQADDAHVAALLAAGDPAAERAALALAINAGSGSRPLLGLSPGLVHPERHVSRGLRRRSRGTPAVKRGPTLVGGAAPKRRRPSARSASPGCPSCGPCRP